MNREEANAYIDQMRREEERREREWNMAHDHRKTMAEINEAHNTRHCSPCSYSRYIEWLCGFMKKGGKPTHYYIYSGKRIGKWYMAETDFEFRPLYGASAFNLIVPNGIIVSGDFGHCGIYFMNDYAHIGSVPVYSDIIF